MAEAESHTDITIVGGGTAGWMAAAILGPLAADGYRVRLIESDQIGTVGVGESTIPQINLYLKAVGIDEDEFLRATQGTYKLGIEFVDWSEPGSRYMHAFGEVGRDLGIVPFQHYWHRARELGFAKPLRHYSLNETAARAGRAQRGRLRTTDALPPMPYAFHLDASLFADFLRGVAEHRGVERIEGKIVEVVRDPHSGDVESVRTEGGENVPGHLFIDCSGFRALLSEGALQSGYDEWTHWLPCDRALTVPCAHGGDGLTPYTRATARDAGWQWRIPLQHRIGNGYVYSSQFTSDDDAAALLLANLDGAPQADPLKLKFVTGIRRKAWNHNVIALGLSAGFIEPLESTSIHLVQTGLQRLLRMLPRGRGTSAEADEFNRQTRAEYERIRDFIILHYKANNRDLPFWRHCSDMEVPDTLAEKIALFRSAGHIVRSDQDLFTEVAWMQVLIGQGVIAERRHPMADSVEEADLRSFLETWEALLEREVRQMPAHANFIASIAAARPAAA